MGIWGLQARKKRRSGFIETFLYDEKGVGGRGGRWKFDGLMG